MSKRLKKKTALLAAGIAIALVTMGATLLRMQEQLIYSSYNSEIEQCQKQLPDLLDEASESAADSTETYDAIYQSKAASVAFMAQNNAGFEATDIKMTEYQNLLEVDNVMIVDRSGAILAKATDTEADFSHARFNALRATFDTDNPSDAVEIETSDGNWLDRYYAAKIDDDTMVVIEQNPAELRNLIETSGSAASVLKNLSVGQNGYVIAISAKNHLITYHPTKKLIGTDALDDGIDVADLEDGAFFHGTFRGKDLYCGVSRIDDTYYVFAVPESATAAARNATVGVILFVFFVVAVTVALYGVFIMRDDECDGSETEKFRGRGFLRYNTTIGKKAAVLSVVGLVFIVGASFYMQTLFALSSQSLANSNQASQISETVQRNSERQAELENEYSERYLSKCRVAAYIVDENPALVTKEKLQDLASILQIAEVYVLDGNGDMIASSSPVKSYSLSTDPKESSYEFRELLGGKEELVQEVSTNDSTGEAEQFIGVATHDERGYASGIVQIAVRPTRLENLIKSVKIDRVLDGVKVGSQGFAFAVAKKNGVVAYYPDERVQGKAATEIGLTEDQLKDGFSDYIEINGDTYFATCVEAGDYHVFVAGPEGELMSERGPLTVTSTIVAALCLFVIFLVLSLDTAHDAQVTTDSEAAAASSHEGRSGNARNIDVTLADGRVKHSESAVSRWLNRSFSWEEKTPEQKLGYVLRWLSGIGMFAIFIAVLLKDRAFGTASVFSYILSGGWTHGLNIFAFTAAIMYACVAACVASMLRYLLRLLSDVLGARGETVCRLLSSAVKYGMMLCMLYWCLGVLGVDTATLLAGAGIVTLAVSFGAKDIVTDILCGLFIIFEGEFRVGDVISVGGITGTVMEIGVRTTKINDGADNVMLMRNSSISNVTNKTKLNSYASLDIVLPIGESLPYVENVLKNELPRIRERIPSVIDGPFYKGVVELTDSGMTIRVVATCKEKDRGALMRALRRELKLALSRNDVAPYQLVYNHEVRQENYQTRMEQKSADDFNKEQIEAAQELGEESSEG